MMMVRRSKGLTDKHKKVLEFVNEYQTQHGRPPSIREIGEKVKISSTSVVNYYLQQLENMGYIERDNRVSRGMRLTDKVHQIVQAGNMLRIPILGPIAAGQPLPELQPGLSYTDNEADAVDIARSLLPSKEKGDNLYALRVQGDSMIDAMINDGDIVVMKQTSEAHNGEMVAIWLPNNNEATLKYFFKEKDRYRLQPANPTMKPIYIKKTEPLEIKGKVVMVIRKVDKPLAV
ncbi:MAG: transcriptional repressor LexA [Chloroflexota bacterium]|nr:repressor LexA [Chloroflexota bacterium]MBI5702088.1 repressor LexA [Chloroflexota bacterium]